MQPKPKTAPMQQKKEPDVLGGLPSMEAMGQAGLPTGGSKQDMKTRLLSLLESIGILDMYKTPDQKLKLNKELDEIIQAFEEKNFELLNQSPLFQKIQQLMPQEQSQQAQAEPAPTKDFASMMPPAGGGLPGR